jgi:drug/metabolite transporter (DMT)-like permease
MTAVASWEFVFLNSVVIGTLSFLYAYVYKREDLTKLATLSWTHYAAILGIGGATVLSTLVYLSYESANVLKMNFLWRAVSSVVFVLSGLFLFGEKVEVNQLVGIGIIIAGSFLVSLEGSD